MRTAGAGRSKGRTRSPLVRDYVERVLAGDQVGVEAVVVQALMARMPPLEISTRIVAPGMEDVGRMWEHGELSVADEHMATEITSAVLLRLLTPVRRTTGPVAVVLCGPDEAHCLGARVLSALLTERGWQAVYLGSRTPADALEALVAARRPELVAFSAKTSGQLPPLNEQARGLAALAPDTKVLVGGAAVTAVERQVAGDHVTDDLADALAWVDRTFGR